MADSKITALASIGTGTDPANDPLVIVDVSDVSPGGMSATGTTKKVTLNNLLACSPTATLASATITGDLTVDTSTLKVDSANNRVGVGTASPGVRVDILSDNNTSLAAVLRVNSNNAAVNTSLAYDGLIGSGAMTLQCGVAPFIVNTNGANERYRIASDGVATWSNVGGVAGTAMTLNSTGLGVGGSVTNKLTVTVTPPTSNSDGLVINGPSFRQIIAGITGATYSYAGVGANQNLIYGGNAQLNILGDNQNVRIGTSAASYLLLDTSGNVGIGVTPSAWSSGIKVLEFGTKGGLAGSGSDVNLIYNAYYDGSNKYRTSDYANNFQISGGQFKWLTAPSGTAGNVITYTQAMTLDASGNLYLKTTSRLSSGVFSVAYVPGTSQGAVFQPSTDVSSPTPILFLNSSGSAVGSITTTASATAYNISSDYRLKESVQPLVGGLARISALKPSIYKWKADGSNGEGFLAHELAEVVPLAVTGEKDAVNEDGSIKAQGVDLSKVVPILVAAIQELTAEVNALKNA